jgi:DDE superfamily endonuclease
MLPFLNLPGSLLEILSALRPCFTAPGFATFCGLVAGLEGQPRRRTVTGMLLGAGLARAWPHDRAHRFFSSARWDPDELGLAVAGLAVLLLLPPGAALRVAVDDSVFRRRGRKVHGAGWQHDGSSPDRRKLSYGCCFVTAALIVRLPFCSREVALPVLARLRLPGRYRHGRRRPDPSLGPGTVEIAAALAGRLALAFPGRAVHVVADGAYHGPALRELPPNVTWTCRIPRNAVLYAPPPPRTGRRGRPRAKGDPLGAPAGIAAAARWEPVTAVTYRGRRDDLRLCDTPCLWHGSWRARPVRLILARNPGTAAGYDLALVTTDLQAAPADLITRYAARWAIEQAFADARNVLGAGEARNRAPRAVERTVPFALLTCAITVIWYALHGHDPADIATRRRDQPWYAAKTEPAFEDMLAKLRRVLITARISGGHPTTPTTRQIQAVLTAWNAAAA